MCGSRALEIESNQIPIVKCCQLCVFCTELSHSKRTARALTLQVYRARLRATGEEVAVKVQRPDALSTISKVSSDTLLPTFLRLAVTLLLISVSAWIP